MNKTLARVELQRGRNKRHCHWHLSKHDPKSIHKSSDAIEVLRYVTFKPYGLLEGRRAILTITRKVGDGRVWGGCKEGVGKG